jgi:hypothetical protein
MEQLSTQEIIIHYTTKLNEVKQNLKSLLSSNMDRKDKKWVCDMEIGYCHDYIEYLIKYAKNMLYNNKKEYDIITALSTKFLSFSTALKCEKQCIEYRDTYNRINQLLDDKTVDWKNKEIAKKYNDEIYEIIWSSTSFNSRIDTGELDDKMPICFKLLFEYKSEFLSNINDELFNLFQECKEIPLQIVFKSGLINS